MKWLMAHFGEAMVAFVCLIALGTVVVGVINGPTIAAQFTDLISTFFTDMRGIGA